MRKGLKRIVRLPGRHDFRDSLETEPFYRWRSDRELVLLRGNAGGGSRGYAPHGIYRFALFDTRTGKEAPLASLNAQHFGDTFRIVDRWCLSPDGARVMWRERARGRREWIAAELDGSGSCRWTQPDSLLAGRLVGDFSWCANSRSWVALTTCLSKGRDLIERLEVAEGSLDRPGDLRESGALHVSADTGWPGPLIVGVGPNGRTIVALLVRGQREAVRFVSFGTVNGALVSEEFTVAPPGGKIVREVAVSPRWDGLAWVLYGRYSAGVDEIWVSNLDGTGMRHMGEVKTKRWLPWADEDHAEALAWSLDGRRVTFLYKDRLWEVRGAG